MSAKRIIACLALALSSVLASAGDTAPPAAAAPQSEPEPEYYAVSAADLQLVVGLIQKQRAEIERLKERLAAGGCT